jgi:short-subunit dehydrogenase
LTAAFAGQALRRGKWGGASVIITGGSRGIGLAIAKEAVQRGARVGLVALSREELDAALCELDGPALAIAADLAEAGAVERVLHELHTKLGPVDVLVNSAGVGGYHAFTETDSETFERLMNVNYFVTLRTIRAVLPGMIQRRRGHIVNIASIAGRISPPFESAYAASKSAVAGLSDALGLEVSPFGIGVSVVNPGAVATDFFAARGRLYTRSWPRPIPPQRVALAVMRAVEDNRAEVFVPAWLRLTWVLRTLCPPLYRWGTRGEVVRELGQPRVALPARHER